MHAMAGISLHSCLDMQIAKAVGFHVQCNKYGTLIVYLKICLGEWMQRCMRIGSREKDVRCVCLNPTVALSVQWITSRDAMQMR